MQKPFHPSCKTRHRTRPLYRNQISCRNQCAASGCPLRASESRQQEIVRAKVHRPAEVLTVDWMVACEILLDPWCVYLRLMRHTDDAVPRSGDDVAEPARVLSEVGQPTTHSAACCVLFKIVGMTVFVTIK